LRKAKIVRKTKETNIAAEVNIDAPWQISYKRQVEIYQWLFRQNGFDVSDTTYFVYCNGMTDKEAFDAKLEFRINVIPYQGNSEWVEEALVKIKKCLDSSEIPAPAPDCDFCAYRKNTQAIEP